MRQEKNSPQTVRKRRKINVFGRSGGGIRFRERFFHELFSSEAFSKWYKDPEYGFVVEGYLSCIPRMYEEYRSRDVSETNRLSTHELAVSAAELIMKGIEGVSGK